MWFRTQSQSQCCDQRKNRTGWSLEGITNHWKDASLSARVSPRVEASSARGEFYQELTNPWCGTVLISLLARTYHLEGESLQPLHDRQPHCLYSEVELTLAENQSMPTWPLATRMTLGKSCHFLKQALRKSWKCCLEQLWREGSHTNKISI